ncbi:MAG: UTP--glucose-1-phosphate uridylyltransferase [Bifidobacteriaceae bacterium]|jgi:UTP--glucose-1-phosphate uridylyltransferase|nr:UTP--glucose-1-phosphate uridylyltransferase [Bifidobacteriaceae bacterium]
MSVTKAVIPAAGLGTRFLPATKAVPKELLPVVDTPALEYVVREASAAGLRDVLLITGKTKGAILDHFDRAWDLEATLEAKGDLERLAAVRASAELATIHAIRQGAPLGLGHAVLCARDHVGDEPFAVLLGDDLIDARDPLLETMIQVRERLGGSVVALMRVPQHQISLYGSAAAEVVDAGRLAGIPGLASGPAQAGDGAVGAPGGGGPPGGDDGVGGLGGDAPPGASGVFGRGADGGDRSGTDGDGVASGHGRSAAGVDGAGVFQLSDLVEKPDPAAAPSDLAIIGRYVLDPAIFGVLENTPPGRGGEIQLTDALGELAAMDPQAGGGLYGVLFTGRRYDTGDRLDYLKAVVRLTADHPELGPPFSRWLAGFVAAGEAAGGGRSAVGADGGRAAAVSGKAASRPEGEADPTGAVGAAPGTGAGATGGSLSEAGAVGVGADGIGQRGRGVGADGGASGGAGAHPGQ